MKRIWFYSAILIFFLVWFGGKHYFSEHAGEIYANRGNKYYRNHQINKAIENYEKAISAGNHSESLRSTYVDLLIQSASTIDTERKLADIAFDNIKDFASQKAEVFLYEIRREIHRKYPKNYIQQAVYNQKIIHWGKIPITYAFKNVSTVPRIYGYEIMNAFKEWEATGKVKFLYTNKSDANIIIEFINNDAKAVEDGEKYVIAYTTPIIQQDVLSQMNIKFNIKNFKGELYSPNQIYNTALHEIFHALGYMGHSYNKGNIMYMSKDSGTEFSDRKLQLTDADISTLELLYKIEPDITNAHDLKYEYIPYLVLGDKNEINYHKIREAKHYIKKAPTLAGGYVDLAESLTAQQKYSEAISILEKALELASNDDERHIIYYNLGVSYYFIGNYYMTHSYIKEAQKIKDSEEMHLLLAETYVKENNISKAISEYNDLLKYAPNNINYVINLANLYINRRSYLKARQVLKNYIKQNPQDKSNTLFKPYGILML